MAPATPNSSGSTRSAAPRKSTPAKKTATRSSSRASSTRRRAGRVTPVTRAQEYAERAVLIQVGAALVARDRVVSTVNEVVDSYATPTKTQNTLKGFERRGATARNHLERDLKKTRTRVERELRERRERVESTVSKLDRRREKTAKDVSSRVETVQSKVEDAVQSTINAGTDFVNGIQERTLNRA
jgi:hypothetical protein